MADKEMVCEFEYDGRKCECKDIVGIARCKNLCKTHFRTVREDNIRKFNKGLDITEDLTFTRKLLFSETWSIFNGILKIEKEVENNGH